MNQQFDPLPYSNSPPAPRPSFAQKLQLSSYLSSSHTRLSSSSATSGEVKPPIKSRSCGQKGELDNDLLTTKHYQITTPSEHCKIAMIKNNTKAKKKVTFQEYVGVFTPVHPLTDDDKRLMWYSQEEYDGFKFDAAHNAGVRLFDYFPPSQTTSLGQGSNATTVYPHKFIMLGNFDEQDEETPSVATTAAVDQGVQPSSNHIKDAGSHQVPTKCMSEYNDTISTDGYQICKRGLGHHFSRLRKRNRVWTRAMVLTWQKTMRSMKLKNGSHHHSTSSQEQSLSLSQKCDVKLDPTSQRLLAAVSAKCSRSARLAALWRGKMDHEVVCRESFKDSCSFATKNSAQICELKTKKRFANHGDEHQCNKRQRFEVRKETTTFSYLAGVLSVEI
ncbi:hypothetical protein ACHAW6_006200 [Cyclotella cf. meneghiniana]